MIYTATVYARQQNALGAFTPHLVPLIAPWNYPRERLHERAVTVATGRDLEVLHVYKVVATPDMRTIAEITADLLSEYASRGSPTRPTPTVVRAEIRGSLYFALLKVGSPILKDSGPSSMSLESGNGQDVFLFCYGGDEFSHMWDRYEYVIAAYRPWFQHALRAILDGAESAGPPCTLTDEFPEVHEVK